MDKKRHRMIFDLTDDDRAALEQLRAARGLRSQAEVLRALIRENTAGGMVVVGVVETPAPTKTVRLKAGAAPAYVKGVVEPEPAKPFKSRLKGEWKAP